MELLLTGSISGVLGLVILYLLNSNRSDRVEHRKERLEWDGRYKDLSEAHETKVAGLQARVDKLEDELREETRRADRAEARLAYRRGGEAS